VASRTRQRTAEERREAGGVIDDERLIFLMEKWKHKRRSDNSGEQAWTVLLYVTTVVHEGAAVFYFHFVFALFYVIKVFECLSVSTSFFPQHLN